MIGEEAVVDLIDIGEIVEGLVVGGLGRLTGVLRLGVRVVEADIVHEDAVETHSVEIRDSFYSVEVIAIALAQGEDGAAGAEDLLPEVGEGSGLGLRVDLDDLLRVDERGEERTRPRSSRAESGEVEHGNLSRNRCGESVVTIVVFRW